MVAWIAQVGKLTVSFNSFAGAGIWENSVYRIMITRKAQFTQLLHSWLHTHLQLQANHLNESLSDLCIWYKKLIFLLAIRHMSQTMAEHIISHYSAQLFESSVEISIDIGRTRDPCDLHAFKLSVFSFEEQMLHICDYLWEGKFQVEGLSKSKKVKCRRKCWKYK